MVAHILQLDHSLRLWVVTHRLWWLDPTMWGLSAIGRGGLVWLAIGAVLMGIKRAGVVLFLELMLAIVLASFTADYVLKPLVSRVRPFNSAVEIAVIGGRPGDMSFPSGHAANSFAAAWVLSRRLSAMRIAWWALAIAIAFSRVYVGVHYPIDVLGGMLLGLLSGVAAEQVVLMANRPRELRA